MIERSSILLRENATTGVRETLHFEDGRAFHQIEHQTQGIASRAEEARKQQEGQKWGDKPRAMAFLPSTVYFDLMKKGIAPHQDEKAFERWIKEPGNRHWAAFDRALL